MFPASGSMYDLMISI